MHATAWARVHVSRGGTTACATPPHTHVLAPVSRVRLWALLLGSCLRSWPERRLALLLGSCLRSWPERRLALALSLLVSPGSECWPDSRLAPGIFFFSSRFARKFNFKFCSRYSNKIFLRASRERLSLSSTFQLYPVSRFMSYLIFFSSRFARKFNFEFCTRYSNKIFLRASRERLSLSSIFQLYPVSRFMSYQGIQITHLAKHWCKVFRECILPNIYVRYSDNTSCQTLM